jgi:ABC-type antimicrobial peptide transport system permease subunit
VTLGSCGVAALAAYRVSQRRREIAVRIALGAQPATVARAVVSQSLGLVAAGAAIGAVAALGMTRMLRSQLHGVSPSDPATMVGVAAILCCTTLAAVWGPARAAARVDPAAALRQS